MKPSLDGSGPGWQKRNLQTGGMTCKQETLEDLRQACWMITLV